MDLFSKSSTKEKENSLNQIYYICNILYNCKTLGLASYKNDNFCMTPKFKFKECQIFVTCYLSNFILINCLYLDGPVFLSNIPVDLVLSTFIWYFVVTIQNNGGMPIMIAIFFN